jgi:hypothetical protein
MSYVGHGGRTRVSEWVALAAGGKYYIEAAHLNGSGGDHFPTGVEIEQEVLNPAHPNNVKEVQKLSFFTEDVRETHRLTINNPDGGTFRIRFQSPDLESSISDEMKTSNSGNTVRDRVKKYFNSIGLNTVVSRKDYDAQNQETEVSDDITKTVFEIKLDRLVAAPSTSAMTIMKGSSKSDIQLEMNVQASNPPMTGQF